MKLTTCAVALLASALASFSPASSATVVRRQPAAIGPVSSFAIPATAAPSLIQGQYELAQPYWLTHDGANAWSSSGMGKQGMGGFSRILRATLPTGFLPSTSVSALSLSPLVAPIQCYDDLIEDPFLPNPVDWVVEYDPQWDNGGPGGIPSLFFEQDLWSLSTSRSLIGVFDDLSRLDVTVTISFQVEDFDQTPPDAVFATLSLLKGATVIAQTDFLAYATPFPPNQWNTVTLTASASDVDRVDVSMDGVFNLLGRFADFKARICANRSHKFRRP